MSRKDDRKWLIAILALAMLARLMFVLAFFGDYKPENDAWHWHRMAENFLAGHGLIIDEKRMAYRTPVPGLYFAVIYAVCGSSVRTVQIANVFLGVLTVWLVYDLVGRIFGYTVARWSALFASLYPTLLLYTGHLFSETPVVFFITLALWLVWFVRSCTAVWFAPVGIVLGLAVLTRQTAFAIGFFIILWILIRRGPGGWLRRMSPALIILAFILLTITPWTIRNYVVTGKFIPLTSQGGDSLWLANNPKVDATAVAAGNFPHIPQIDALPEVEREAAYRKLALQFIREDPVRFAQLSLRRLQYFWHLGYHGKGFAEVVFLAVYLPILSLALIGVWRGWRLNRDAVLLLMTIPASLTVVHSVFFPQGRYRLPAELALCMLAGLGAAWGFSKVLERLRPLG